MNIVDLPETNKLESALATFKTNFKYLVEYQQLLAQLRKSSYDAHIEQGFTAEEALELCKQVVS